jgi:hypothetical protein
MNAKPSAKDTSLRPIFIGGLMKSGTTLLRALLGQHPRLFGSFETHWFDDSVRFGWGEPESRRMRLLFSLLGLERDEYDHLCLQMQAEPRREFIDVVMQYCCERAGKARWVEKTPDNIRHWRLIQQSWREPTLIHVTREYKDVYASWKIRRGDSLEIFLAAAKTAYEDIRPTLGRDSQGYLEVDYQDLVCDTETVMRRILDRVGEDWHPGCAVLDVDHGTRERTKFKQLMGRESWTLVSLSKPIFTNSIGQWREHLSKEEAARIETELAEYYEIFGAKWEQRENEVSTSTRT